MEESKKHWSAIQSEKIDQIDAPGGAIKVIQKQEWGCPQNLDICVEIDKKVLREWITALMNSRYLGCVCVRLQINKNTKDDLVQKLSSVQPHVQVCDAADSGRNQVDEYVRVTTVPKLGIRFDVVKRNYEKHYFNSISHDDCNSGVKTSLTQERLMTRLIDIDPTNMMEVPPNVFVDEVDLDLGTKLEEIDRSEQKEIRWWNKRMQGSFIRRKGNAQPGLNELIKCLNKFLEQYPPRMYSVDASSVALDNTILLGFHEDYGALGFPLLTSTSKESIQNVVKDHYGQFFPSYTGSVILEFQKLKIPQDWLLRDKTNCLVLVDIGSIDTIRQLKIADFCCAVRFQDQDVDSVAIGLWNPVPERPTCVHSEGQLTFSFKNENRKDEILSGTIGAKEFALLDHYCLAIRAVPDVSKRAAGALMIPKKSFSLTLYNDAALYELSPMATCAWLSYETEIHKIQHALMNEKTSTRILCGSENKLKSFNIKSCRREYPADTEDPDVILAFGCTYFDLTGGKLEHDRRHTWFLVDYDARRLQSTVTAFMTNKEEKDFVDCIMLVPFEKFGELFRHPSTEANELHPSSREACKLIQCYLRKELNVTELFKKDASILDAATAYRKGAVDYLKKELFSRISVEGPIAFKCAVSIVPGCGTTTTLLQLISSVRSEEKSFASLCTNTNWEKVLSDLRDSRPSKVLLVVDGDDPPLLIKKSEQVKQLIEEKSKLAFAAVVLCVKRLTIFHDELPLGRCYTFDISIDGKERDKLIEIYKLNFADYGSAFDSLKTALEKHDMLVHTPATLLTGADVDVYAKKDAFTAVKFVLDSLDEYDGGGEHHRLYLVHLCLLTCTSKKGQIKLGKYKFKSIRWSFLLTDPKGDVHSLTSRMWIPALLTFLTPSLGVKVKGTSYTLSFTNSQIFAKLMVDALVAALKTGSGLKPWIQRRKNIKIPTWLQLLEDQKNQDCCLEALIKRVKELQEINSHRSEELSGILIQLHILRVDIVSMRKSKEDWDGQVKPRLLELLGLDHNNFLVHHYVGNGFFKATKLFFRDLAFVKSCSKQWMERFESCLELASKQRELKVSLVKFMNNKRDYIGMQIHLCSDYELSNFWKTLESSFCKMLKHYGIKTKCEHVSDPSMIKIEPRSQDELLMIDKTDDDCDPNTEYLAEVLIDMDEKDDNADEGETAVTMIPAKDSVSLEWFLPHASLNK